MVVLSCDIQCERGEDSVLVCLLSMIVAAIIGLLVGYVLAIPPGPIGMASVRTGLRDGWPASVKLAIGAGLLDLVYCALAMWASSAVVGALDALESGNPLVTLVIQFVIVAVMITFGIVQVRERTIEEPSAVAAKGVSAVQRITSHGPFFVGVGFALANLANPTFIPAVMAMTTFVQKMSLFEETALNAMVFSIGFGVGNTLWLLTLVRIVLALRSRLTPTLIHRIQQFSGVTLIGFGAFYAYRIAATTPWSELTRML